MKVDYFGRDVFLSQSWKLYGEAMMPALEKIYCITPAFRSEKSKTSRHLIEYWTAEIEVAFHSGNAFLGCLAVIQQNSFQGNIAVTIGEPVYVCRVTRVIGALSELGGGYGSLSPGAVTEKQARVSLEHIHSERKAETEKGKTGELEKYLLKILKFHHLVLTPGDE